jgi:hypothetical protein
MKFRNPNHGKLEFWSNGMMECWGGIPSVLFHYSNIPLFHSLSGYSSLRLFVPLRQGS